MRAEADTLLAEVKVCAVALPLAFASAASIASRFFSVILIFIVCVCLFFRVMASVSACECQDKPLAVLRYSETGRRSFEF